MSKGQAGRPQVFSAQCPYFNRTAILYLDTWRYKILPHHPEVKSCVRFIEETIVAMNKSSMVYRKLKEPESIAVFKECHLLAPLYRYMKIALRLIDNRIAVITTAHGLNNAPSKGMEKI